MSYLLFQSWRDLLFAHWPVQERQIQPWIPPGITIDRYAGEAWIAVVPFLMTGIRFRGTPALPYLSRTLELNLRTYVTVGGRPGVFFFSLDAASPVAVRIARRFFHLPYFDARMECTEKSGIFDYRSERTEEPAASFHGRYRPVGGVIRSAPGSLEHFLTERYCFYTTNRSGEILRGDIVHEPWPLQAAEAEFPDNGLTLPWKIELPDTAPLLHFARRIDIRAQRLRRVDADRGI
jgi:uncharacterized protein YqjF (DUF2071 family)